MSKLHSIQVLIEEEPVTIIFKTLKTGAKVAKVLQDHFQSVQNSETKSVEQVDKTTAETAQSEAIELIKYTRINIPRIRTCRTFTSAFDQQTIQDLIKSQAPPARPQIPSLILAAIQTTGGQERNQQLLNPHLTELSKSIYQFLVAVFQRDPNLLVAASAQQNTPIDRANSTQIQHLIQQMTSRLVSLPFSDLINKMMEFTSPHSNLIQFKDKIIELSQKLRIMEQQQQVSRKVPTYQLQTPPLNVPTSILPKVAPPLPNMNGMGNMGNSLGNNINNMNSLRPPSITPAIQIQAVSSQWQQQQQILKNQQQAQQDTKTPAEIRRQKIQQTETVLETIMPERIATLLHGSQQLVFTRQMTTQVNERNTVSLSEKFKGKPYEVLRSMNIIQKVCEAWESGVQKQGAPIQDEDALNLSEKIVKLYEVIGKKHVDLVKSAPLTKFHASFTPNENLLLLLLVQRQLAAGSALAEPQFDFGPLYQEMHDNFCLNVFDKLYSVIQQVGQVQKKINQPLPVGQQFAIPSFNQNIPLPQQSQQIQLPQPPSQNHYQPVKQETLRPPHVSAPPAIAAAPPPSTQHTHQSASQAASGQFTKQQMHETQGLIRSNQNQYQELKNVLPPSDIFKALVLIISIGDEYKKDINIIRQLLLQECSQIIKKMNFSAAMDGEKLKTIFVQLLSGFLNYIKSQKIQTQDEKHRKELMLKVDPDSKIGRFSFEEIVDAYKSEVSRVNARLSEIKMAFDPSDWKDQFQQLLMDEPFYYVELSQIKTILQLDPTEEMLQYCIDTSPSQPKE